MFYTADEIIRSLEAQAADLESLDESSKDAEALRVAADLLKKTIIPRDPGARVLPLEVLDPSWERLWLQLKYMPDGGEITVAGRQKGLGMAWKLEGRGSVYIMSGDLYNRTWRVWDRPPTGKDMAEWPWEGEEHEA